MPNQPANLRNHARALRQNQTPFEAELWQHLRAKRFSAFKFRRQQPIGHYIVDFVCFQARLIIELDGSQHMEAADYDSRRDAWLKSQGFTVLRFWNNEWSQQREAVLEKIWRVLHESPPCQFSPPPQPLPHEGGGAFTPHSSCG